MSKQVKTVIKLQIKGGQANPAPPVGPALGQAGINIMEFCKAYNDQTKDRQGEVIPVEITAFVDSTFELMTFRSTSLQMATPNKERWLAFLKFWLSACCLERRWKMCFRFGKMEVVNCSAVVLRLL